MISNFAFFTALQNAADLKVSVGAAFCNAVKMQKSSRTIILIFKQFFAVKHRKTIPACDEEVRREEDWARPTKNAAQ